MGIIAESGLSSDPIRKGRQPSVAHGRHSGLGTAGKWVLGKVPQIRSVSLCRLNLLVRKEQVRGLGAPRPQCRHWYQIGTTLEESIPT